MYLFIGLNLQVGCKQNAFEIHLDVSEIYFRCNFNVFNPIQAGGGGHIVPPIQVFPCCAEMFSNNFRYSTTKTGKYVKELPLSFP